MMDTATAARAVHGRVIGANVRFTRVTTDTRTLAPGDLFVALEGERFDGHDFVAAALRARRRGGAGRRRAAPGRCPGNLIAVDDPLAALGRLAAHWRARFALPVIVVVGSNGKTTVKEMLASILRAHFGDEPVLATRGNLNNAIGLPLTLLGLRAQHRAAVIELGMNHPGETAELAAIAQPTVAVVNNAQREHQEFMRSIADVAEEHAALVRALPADGVAVVNADDAHVDVWRAAARGHGCVSSTSRSTTRRRCAAATRAAPARSTSRRAAGDGDASGWRCPGATTRPTRWRRRRRRWPSACRSPRSCAGSKPSVRSPAAWSRGRRRAASTVIDDTYNANPDSVRAAIDVLAEMPGPRWLVLGDMGEVGAQGPAFHREIGEYARARGVDRLLTAGALAGGERRGLRRGRAAVRDGRGAAGPASRRTRRSAPRCWSRARASCAWSASSARSCGAPAAGGTH